MTNKKEKQVQIGVLIFVTAVTLGLLIFTNIDKARLIESFSFAVGIGCIALSLMNIDFVYKDGRVQPVIGTLSKVQFLLGAILVPVKYLPLKVGSYADPWFWFQFVAIAIMVISIYWTIKDIVATYRYIANDRKKKEAPKSG